MGRLELRRVPFGYFRTGFFSASQPLASRLRPDKWRGAWRDNAVDWSRKLTYLVKELNPLIACMGWIYRQLKSKKLSPLKGADIENISQIGDGIIYVSGSGYKCRKNPIKQARS